MVNPGSLTSPRDDKPASVAILDVDDEQDISCTFVPVD